MLAALSVLALVGCNKSSEPTQFEPVVGTMVLSAEGIDYQATSSAGGFGGQVMNIQNGAVFITASFLKMNGSIDFNITADDFQLKVAGNNAGGPLPVGITWEPSGAFSGNLTGLTEGQQVSVYFSLYHKSQAHTDFGPYFLAVVRAVGGGGGGGGGGNL